MKHVVLISPFSTKLSSGEENPKNYPHWKKVVSGLKNLGFYTIQLGLSGEYDIECHAKIFNAPLCFLLDLARNTTTWASVDNFFPHLCQQGSRPGVVIWGQSDPKLFGYETNTNLLKDKKYLRPNDQQYWLWTQTTYCEEAFVDAETVINAIFELAKKNK